MFKTLKKR